MTSTILYPWEIDKNACYFPLLFFATPLHIAVHKHHEILPSRTSSHKTSWVQSIQPFPPFVVQKVNDVILWIRGIQCMLLATKSDIIVIGLHFWAHQPTCSFLCKGDDKKMNCKQRKTHTCVLLTSHECST